MGLAQPDDVLFAHQRLAAGVEEEVAAQVVGLADDAVYLLVGQVELVAVLGRPAAGAVQVAGGGGVEQNGPGDVAAVLFGVALLLLVAKEAGVEAEVAEGGLEHVVVHVAPQVHQVAVPDVFRVAEHFAEHRGQVLVPAQVLQEAQQPGQVLFRVAGDVVHCGGQRCLAQRLLDAHGYFSSFASSPEGASFFSRKASTNAFSTFL